MKPHWPIPKGLHWSDVNGYPLCFRDEGRGQPIILIHGSITDYRVWEPTIAALTSTYRVIAPSLRHFYPEHWEGSGDDFSIEQHAQDLLELVNKLELRKVHLLGWSRGGRVAIEVALRAPNIIRSLILEDANFTLLDPTEAASNSAVDAGRMRRQRLLETLRAGEYTRAAEELVDGLNGAGYWSRLPAERRQIMLDNICTAQAPDVRQPLPREAFARFEFPVLLITGEHSPTQYRLFYEEIGKVRDFGATVVVPKAAHFVHVDNADCFNDAVLTFLTRHART